MTAIKANKDVFQYVVIGLTVAVLLLEMTSFCSTGWLRFEGTTGNNTDRELGHQNRNRREMNPNARVPGGRKPSTYKPVSPKSESTNDRPRPKPSTKSPRTTSNSFNRRPLIMMGNGEGRNTGLPQRPKPTPNQGTSMSQPSKGHRGDSNNSSSKPKPNGDISSGRTPLSSRRPEMAPSLGPGPYTVTKRPPLNWKPSPSKSPVNTNEGEDSVYQTVMIDIGLWSVRICEDGIVGEENSCGRSDNLNDVNEDDLLLTDVRIEAVFAIIFGMVGCISTALTLFPSCLKDKRQILLIFAICGLTLSGLLYLITIARVVSLTPKIRDVAGRDNTNLRMKTPWCLVVGGIGAGLALITSGLLATGKWLDKQKVWSELSDQVEFSREPKSEST